MRLFSEPESWIGLRSERTVAGEFDAPEATPIVPRPAALERPTLSVRAIHSVMRRRWSTLLGH